MRHPARPGSPPCPSRRPRASVATCADLLVGEGEPALQLRRASAGSSSTSCGTWSREVEVDDRRPSAQTAESCSSFAERRLEVAAPDVVAVDDAADERLVACVQRPGRHGALAPGRARSPRPARPRAPGGRRRGCRTAPRRRCPGGRPGAEQRRTRSAVAASTSPRGHVDALADQRRLVELHPRRRPPRRGGRAARGRPAAGRRAATAAEALGRAVARLAQQQEGDRADDDRTGDEAGGGRLLELAHEAVGREAEVGLRADLRHEVVVVGVEPLRHLERGVVALAAGDREVAGEVDRAVVIRRGRRTAPGSRRR